MWLSRLFAYEENRTKFCDLFHGAMANIGTVVTSFEGELVKQIIGGIVSGHEVVFQGCA